MNESAGKRRIEFDNFFGGFFVIPEVVDGIGRADVVTAETDVVGSSSVFWGGGDQLDCGDYRVGVSLVLTWSFLHGRVC